MESRCHYEGWDSCTRSSQKLALWSHDKGDPGFNLQGVSMFTFVFHSPKTCKLIGDGKFIFLGICVLCVCLYFSALQ